jgi:hypothetical protein
MLMLQEEHRAETETRIARKKFFQVHSKFLQQAASSRRRKEQEEEQKTKKFDEYRQNNALL